MERPTLLVGRNAIERPEFRERVCEPVHGTGDVLERLSCLRDEVG